MTDSCGTVHCFQLVDMLLLYGSDVWGCEDIVVSKFQLQYLKMLLRCELSNPYIVQFD